MKTVRFLMCVLVMTPWASAKSIKDLGLEQPLPTFITPVTTFGQRPDWSHDNRHVIFLEKTYGDVYEVDIVTREVIPLTHDYYHEGYTRALYLPNGDILLSGAREFDAKNPGASRSEKNAELWVLRPHSGKPPVALGSFCREGPSVSRTQMRIAWALSEDFYLADIVYDEKETPWLANKRVVLSEKDLPREDSWHIEAQNFRPGAEHELIFNMFDRDHNFLAEVMGLDLNTGKIVNYTNRPDRYDEPEGIFPDGKRILVESSRHRHNYQDFKNYDHIDLYVLELDGSGTMTRLTFFNENPTFKCTQGVISDDGHYMAFQISKTTDMTGFGY
ncbi:MAG: hypothetical protein MI922_25710, partial [Bacteroidales bacterium]|nr:hypothetical protein [Bacteroidales bacterium]